MAWDFSFFFNSILLGIGLAMDAFSVSVANGLRQPNMKTGKMCGIAGLFAFFQALMPMIGWLCIHTIVQYFKAFETLIPWIALVLLLYIGGKMIYDCLKGCDEECQAAGVGFTALIVQGIATSIDALSVGFTIADYSLVMALAAAGVIAAITFVICLAGIAIGRKAGAHMADRAGLFGGIILILIGIEIFVTSWL